MPDWSTIIIVMGFFAGIGPIIDRLMLNRHKGRLYDWLLLLWNRLDETNIPNLPRLMAEWSLSIIRRTIGQKIYSIKSIGKIIFISALLTTMGITLPMYFIIDKHSVSLMFVISCFIFLGPINLPFDLITVFVSYKILKIIRLKSPIVGLAAIILDLILAIILAILCASTITIDLEEFSVSKAFVMALDGVKRAVFTLFGIMPISLEGDYDFLYVAGFLGSTTLIPTILYMGLMLILLISKPISEFAKKTAMYFFESVTEDKPEKLIVFTLLGSIASAIVLIAKTFQHFLTINP
jgi:hypothetical protein